MLYLNKILKLVASIKEIGLTLDELGLSFKYHPNRIRH
ncbi:hypothetical protein J2Z23_001716 [Lederbergia galactosidilyticus]|nr:hypothetical protein [Lederbergia galactosidilytica]